LAQASFAQRLVLPVKGTVLPTALLLADADGDGGYELIIGTMDGCWLCFFFFISSFAMLLILCLLVSES
jgi:hypothetical protein